MRLLDRPGLPWMYRAEALDGPETLKLRRSEGQRLVWTYVSPAIEIGPGERTGRSRTTLAQMLVDQDGKSFISVDDYAVAVLDGLEKPRHVGRRFGVAHGWRQGGDEGAG